MEKGTSLAMKKAMLLLDEQLVKKGVSSSARAAVINSIELMYDYIPYAIAQGKNPSDGKVLAEFLLTHGGKTAKYLGNDAVNCGVAIVDFLLSIRTAASTSEILPVAFLTWGIAMLNLLEVGNSCEPAQMLTYELFMKTSSVKLNPIVKEVNNANTMP